MDSSLLSEAGRTVVENLSIFQPTSPQAASIRNLSILVFAITGFIFLLVEGVLFYCVLRFRRRKAAVLPTASPVEPEPAATEPPQVYGSKPIEIAWTAAPALIVFILTLVTTRTLWEVKTNPPKPTAEDQTLHVTVVGRQWWWEFHYEYFNGKKLGFVTANELHIPVSDDAIRRPVYLTLKSADVCHSFWVPRLGGKTDLIPGRVNSMWFETKETGLFLGQCAEYCGTQHAGMLLRVVVDTPQTFSKWLENESKPAVDSPALAAGKAAFLAQSCVNCHTVRGTLANGTYAPDLTHLMSRQTLASGMVPNTPANLSRWVEAPQSIKPGCLMPAFGLSERDRDLVVSYLQNLR